MKKIFSTVTVFLISGLMMTPTLEARSRTKTTTTTTTSTGASKTHTSTTKTNNNKTSNNNTNKNNNNTTTKPTNDQQPANNNNQQPVNNNQQPVNNNNNQKPNDNQQPVNNNNNNQKPNNNQQPVNNNQKPNDNQQPVNNNNNNQKPNNNQQPVNNNQKPNNNQQPVNNNKNNNKPSSPVPYISDLPARPQEKTRPTEPAKDKRYSKSLFTNILGVALGTAISNTVDYLYNSGYSVVGYGDNVVILNNVTELGYTWPIGTFNYENGYMESSEFIYTTDTYDLTRYNKVYNTLVSNFGAPVSVNNTSNTMSTTWWGTNEYITLEFGPGYDKNGTQKYITRLELGK